MTAALLDRPVLAAERPALDGPATLEELLTSALHEARTNGSTDCPVCHARMTARACSTRAGAREGGAPAASAECGGCGSCLS